MAAALKMSDAISEMKFTLNPIKIASGTVKLTYEAMRLTTHLALDVITGKRENMSSAFARWSEFCQKFGIPATPGQAIENTFILTRAGIALSQEVLTLIHQSIFNKKRKSLAGELALVVGSNQPLGAQLAFKLAEAQAKIICMGHLSPDLETASKTINEHGGEAYYYQCDITDEGEVLRVISAINKDVGDITMLFNCYGFPDKDTTSSQDASEIIDRCILGNFYLLENIIPVMKGNGKGQIVLMKSVDAMMKTKRHRVPTIISQYACEGLYASSMDKLEELKASEAVKTSMVRVYPEVVELENGKKPKGCGYFGNIEAKLTAEIIVNGIKNGYKEFSAPSSAVFIETIVGMLPLHVGLKVRQMLYR